MNIVSDYDYCQFGIDKWNGTIQTVIAGGNTSTFLDLSNIKK